MLFLVNHEAAVERRERMLRQFAAASLEAHRVGIDLQRHPQNELRDELAQRFPRLQFDFRRLGGAELGGWASHLTVWMRLLDSSEPAATVIEDDVLLSDAFRKAIEALNASSPLDVVYLGATTRRNAGRRPQAPGELTVHAATGSMLSSRAYTIRRDYVERFFAHCRKPIDVPINHFLSGRARWARPSIGVLRPSVIWEDLRLSRQSEPGRQRQWWGRSSFRHWTLGRRLAGRGDRLLYESVFKLL